MSRQTLQPTVTRLSLAIGLSLVALAVQAQVQLPAPVAPAAQPAASGVSGVVIRDVRVEGLQRIEPGTVFSYLPIKVGDRISENGITESVRLLFATGFFKDVRVELEGDVLVVLLEERPAIGVVEITGSKEFDKETLKKALADSGLAEARIFDRALLDRAEQELKRQYLGRGKYDVQIQSTITPLERNRVAVSIAIDEGEDARIKEIRIVGAKAFKEKDLLSEFKLSTPTWMSWYTKSDQYSRQKLTGDIETLKSFYLNRGYLEFVVDATQVSLSADRKDVFITLVINEGEKFNVGEVKLAGDLLGQPAQFEKLQTLKSGEVFSQEKLLAVTKAMTDRMGELGYAFANVNPMPRIDRTSKRVDFTLQLDPGRRVYVRRINISGNAKTRDEVIRREMRQFEASWYDSERIRLSRNRVDRLGYFKSVDVDTEAVTGAGDQVDVNVRVEERPLGSLTFGVGFSSSDKLVLSGSISQQNFLGTGTNVSFEVNTSKVNKTFAFTHVDPYWTDDGVSRSFDLYTRTFNADEVNSLGAYTIKSTGLGLRFGIPYTEEDRIFVGAAAERSEVSGTLTNLPNWTSFTAAHGNSATAYLATLGWSRDSRDSGIAPSTGRFQYFNADYATPVGDLEYLRLTYGHQWFKPITKSITYAINTELGYGIGLGGDDYPATKNFYAGGIGSVRAFASSTIGPKGGTDNATALGGNRRLVINNELLFPLPGMAQDRTIRLFTYFDMGNVWGENVSDNGSVRASVGAGLSWLSPVGPLKLSMGNAIRKETNDRTQRLQFQIGTGF
ncbi:MAG: outer membrane protein assembly factor BamA [Burkholderiaceae bacterium]